eukprot:9305859-Pyramimonas_sp.AAC.1
MSAKSSLTAGRASLRRYPAALSKAFLMGPRRQLREDRAQGLRCDEAHPEEDDEEEVDVEAPGEE